MNLLRAMSGRIHPHRLVHVVLLGFLLIPAFLFLTVLKPQLDPLSLLNLQVSLRRSVKIKVLEDNSGFSDEHDDEVIVRRLPLESATGEEKPVANIEVVQLPIPVQENPSNNVTVSGTEISDLTVNIGEKDQTVTDLENTEVIEEPHSTEKEEPHSTEKEQETHDSVDADTAPSSKVLCDFSQRRSDTCVLHGDVRVLGSSSSILLVENSQDASSQERTTWSIRPYARKWEAPVMELIRELSIKASDPRSMATPECSVDHHVPAVVFSTGGFSGKNFFHDFSDVLIPLFITSYQFHGRVQFLVTNFNPRWISRYEVILKRLSNYEIINLDRDSRVHCFQNAHVGLMSHSELVIDPGKTPNNYSMADFRELLRSCFSLKRKSVRIGHAKPRLLLMLRKGSRLLTNKREVVSLARRLGFKVVVSGPEHTKNLSRFAGIVNSCDVMMGVHGAGLTNMVFLPSNATLIQVIPWGGLRYACNHDYGDPTAAMGVRYLEYEVRQEESSLVKQYPRDHPVFTDPASIHRHGWNALWSVFLNRQNIKLDVRRFRGVLEEAIRAVPR